MPTCPNCGQGNPEGARFCNACGCALADAGRPGEERRLVSVLFVDLVGFTPQAEKLDPEDVRAILTPYYERVRAELERFGGVVEKFVGDAVLGLFGAPTAYGDDAERAVRAGFGIRDWAEQEGLQIRVAVNTGEAIVELERPAGTRAGDGRRGRRQHRRAAPVRGTRRRGARRRGDVRQHPERHRVPPRPARARKGEERTGERLGRAAPDVGRRRAADDARADDRP